MSRILRAKEAQAKLGIGKSKFYNDVKNRLLPQPVRLGGRAVGYIETEIDEHIARLKSDRDRNGNDTVPRQPRDPPDDDEEDDHQPRR